MNFLLRATFQSKNAIRKNGHHTLMENSKMLFFRSFNHMRVAFLSHKIKISQFHPNHKLFSDFFRALSNDSSNNNNNNSAGPRAIIIPKALSRLTRKKKIKETLEDRQRIFQKGVENVLGNRKIALTNTRKKIQEKGKLIMQDLKETKEKMKEKLEEVIEKENVYTIPNLLCVTRIGLSPLLSYLIVSKEFEYALGFMVVAGVSDWSFCALLNVRNERNGTERYPTMKFIVHWHSTSSKVDGWIARNFNSQCSKIGSFLDPMADKVLIGTLFISLTYINLIPFPLTALIIGRDVILIISGFVIRYRSLPPPRTLSRYFDVTHATAQLAPTFISKVNTGIQLVLAAATLAAPVLGYVNNQFLQIMWYVTASSTVVAASSYIFSKETYRYLKTKEKVKNIKRK